ncbi:amino acid deaminase/aldolase [Bacillus sp. JJ722]
MKQISFPALLLDNAAFESNCKSIAAKANGKRIRIATKSIRSIKVLQRILTSDSVYQGLMCFSPREALFLIEKGFDDLLIGYPCWDKEALLEIAKHNQNGKKIICMVDSKVHIDFFERIGKEVNGKLYLCIDVDMSTKFGNLHFGVRRSPLSDEESVLAIARKIKQSEHLELIGVMGYEAQIAGVGEQMPSQRMKNKVVAYMKRKSINEIATRRKEIVEVLQQEGFTLTFVNGGGTGSVDSTSSEDVVTEISVGSGIYSPMLFDYYSSFQYKPALFFALPIVRIPTPNIYTCLGGGYIASGPAGKDKVPQPVYPKGGKLLSLEGAGEVQTPVYFEQAKLQIGDPIVFRAAKAGEICERFQEILCISNGQILDRYDTYRGEGVCFL